VCRGCPRHASGRSLRPFGLSLTACPLRFTHPACTCFPSPVTSHGHPIPASSFAKSRSPGSSRRAECEGSTDFTRTADLTRHGADRRATVTVRVPRSRPQKDRSANGSSAIVSGTDGTGGSNSRSCTGYGCSLYPEALKRSRPCLKAGFFSSAQTGLATALRAGPPRGEIGSRHRLRPHRGARSGIVFHRSPLPLRRTTSKTACVAKCCARQRCSHQIEASWEVVSVWERLGRLAMSHRGLALRPWLQIRALAKAKAWLLG